MCFRQLASCGISKWCLWQISQKSMSPATTLLTTYQPAMGCLVSSPGIYTMLIDEEMSIYARWSQREQDAPAAWKHCAVQRAPCQPLRASPAPHHAPETAARHTRPSCTDCQRPGTKEETHQCENPCAQVLELPTLLLHLCLRSHSNLRQGPSADTYPQSAAGEALL